MKNEIKLFEQQKVRTHWDEKEEKWYFSIIDVIAILTDSVNPRDYWFKMKIRVKTEDGLELSTVCRQLKLKATDGKMIETDVADTQLLLRIIQSIPSPKAEPFKQWLAKVGYERMQEIAGPEQSLDRARENWQKLGRSEKWIQQRMTGQETRNKLTDYWKQSGVQKQDEFAFLTNIIHQEWSSLTVKQHKSLKSLKTQNLRDHMPAYRSDGIPARRHERSGINLHCSRRTLNPTNCRNRKSKRLATKCSSRKERWKDSQRCKACFRKEDRKESSNWCEFFTTIKAKQKTEIALLIIRKSVKSLNLFKSVILTIYDIVKAHGGELKVEMKEGEETEFLLKLPLR